MLPHFAFLVKSLNVVCVSASTPQPFAAPTQPLLRLAFTRPTWLTTAPSGAGHKRGFYHRLFCLSNPLTAVCTHCRLALVTTAHRTTTLAHNQFADSAALCSAYRTFRRWAQARILPPLVLPVKSAHRCFALIVARHSLLHVPYNHSGAQPAR
jgi:hypothetical protein